MQIQSGASYILAVTTSQRESYDTVSQGQAFAQELNALFVRRNDRPLSEIFEETLASRILVVRHDRLTLVDCQGQEYMYHPNLALVRALNYVRNGGDHFLEAAALSEGDRVLDCTIGFGCEALLASMMVGETGEVVAMESVPELAIVTRTGMREYPLKQKRLEQAMRRVIVITADYRTYLPHAANRSVDIVYFDPFFASPIEGSEHTVSALAQFGNRAPLDVASVREARRVSRRHVLIKYPRHAGIPDEIKADVSDVIAGRNSPVCFAKIHGY